MPARGVGAYRGASNTHPANTLAAFREAVRLGAHMIEMDVRLTKDEQVVVIHDPSVDMTADGHGMVADLTLEQIKRLDAGIRKAERFKGERIPTLREALRIMPANIWLNIHMHSGFEGPEGRLGALVAQAVVDEKRLHQAFLSCNRPDAEAALKAGPTVMVSCSDFAFEEEYIRRMAASGSGSVVFVYGGLRPAAAQARQSKSAVVYVVNMGITGSGDVDFGLTPDVEWAVKKFAQQAGIPPLRPLYRSGAR